LRRVDEQVGPHEIENRSAIASSVLNVEFVDPDEAKKGTHLGGRWVTTISGLPASDDVIIQDFCHLPFLLRGLHLIESVHVGAISQPAQQPRQHLCDLG
jgi:hypothetical protein